MVVKVDFQPSGDGARIGSEARVDWFSAIFATAWSGFLFLVGGIVLVLLLGGAATPAPGVPLFVALLMPVGMIMLALLLPWLGYRSAMRNADFVADFVKTLLRADDDVPAAGAVRLE
jgi:hypothetical protein